MQKTVLDHIFKPKTVAVIGASAKPGSLGNTVMRKMTEFGYTGELYPINPTSPEIMGKKCYKTVTEIPGEVDMAVICVPGKFVLDVFKDCIAKKIPGCVIISAGFKEIGPEGVEREKELQRLGKESGIRIVGPNCFGYINGDPEISVDCTFARNLSSRGRVGLISQSGAFGACVVEELRRTTMGLSLFITLGNRIDFDENEALEYLGNDPKTGVIILYLENFADPRKFIEQAKKIVPQKPIILLKAGKSSHGAAAAASHTGMMAQSDTMVDALVKKAGIIRVNSVPEIIMAAKALYSGVLPEKDDMAVITNAGGFGVMAIDRAEELGLELAGFTPETTQYLENNLPVEASCHNPVDLLGTANAHHYGITLEGLLKDENVGGVICNFGPPVMQSADEIAEVVVEKAQSYPDKPVLSIYMNRNRIMKALAENEGVYVSQFDFPEDAAWAYSKILEYKKIKNTEIKDPEKFDADEQLVDEILKNAINEGRDRLDFDEGEAVLRAYGIPVANSVHIFPEDNFREKLFAIKFPVAIKPAWGGVTHKTEMKAVVLNLKNPEEVAGAVRDVAKRIEEGMGIKYEHGFIVQEMKPGGTEIILGAIKQDSGIHLVMFGLGGIFVELMKDVSFGIPPLTRREAFAMIERTAGYKMLKGFRGKEGVDLQEIEDTILRISQLVNQHPEIKELDVNPFMAMTEKGMSSAVDVRIILEK